MPNTIFFEAQNLKEAKCALENEFSLSSDDYISFSYEELKIDDARRLQEILVSYSGNILIFALSINKEAQNALLKSTEELSQNVRLFLSLPSAEFMLETLRSRFVRHSNIKSKDKETKSKNSFSFCQLSISQRLDKLSKMNEEELHDFFVEFEEFLLLKMKSSAKEAGRLKAFLELKKALIEKKGIKKAALEKLAFLC